MILIHWKRQQIATEHQHLQLMHHHHHLQLQILKSIHSFQLMLHKTFRVNYVSSHPQYFRKYKKISYL